MIFWVLFIKQFVHQVSALLQALNKDTNHGKNYKKKNKTLIDIYLGGLIEHSNIKGDGDHNVNDRDYSIRDPVDWATRIQIRDKRLIWNSLIIFGLILKALIIHVLAY